MSRVSEIYFARVAGSGVPFDPVAHARSDLIAESAVFSQMRGDAASIEIRCIYPDGGLIGGNRWGILSARVDGIVREIARGQIVGYPIALAGQLVTVEIVCKALNASAQTDNLFLAKNALVPKQVEPSEEPRRTEPYLLCDVYHDPITLDPSFDPIAGSAAPAAILYGEGAPAGAKAVFDLELSISDAPVDHIDINEVTVFEQEIWGDVNLGDAISSVPAARRATYTPLALEAALQSITLDGGYEKKNAYVDYTDGLALRVYTSKRHVDPLTCIVTKAEYVEFPRKNISEVEMKAFYNATQPRRELVQIPIDVKLSDFGGAAQLIETSALTDPDNLALGSYAMSYTLRNRTGTTFHSTTRQGVRSSVWTDGPTLRAALQPCLTALAMRAARIAIERAHAVQITVTADIDSALDLTLKDRVRIYDSRLPGGTAVGKVVGIELSFGAASLSTIRLACPVSDPANLAPAPAGTDAWGAGLASVAISSTIADADDIPTTPQMSAATAGLAAGLVTAIDLVDAINVQTAEIGGTNETTVQIADPEKIIPKTGITMRLRDLTPASLESLGDRGITFSPTVVRLPEGIQL